MSKTLIDKAKFLSPQQSQEHELLGEICKTLEAHGTSLAALPPELVEKFKGYAAEISRLSDEVKNVQKSAVDRFNAIAEQTGRAGNYRGAFASAEQAAAAGRMFAFACTKDEALKADLLKAGLSPASGELGGFLLPEQILDGITRNVEQYGVFERNVNVIPTTTQSTGKLKRTQGATVYYPDIGVAPTESVLKVGKNQVQLKRWSVLCLIDRWMMASDLAVALGEYVASEMGYALALAEDTNGIMGDGTSTYARVTGLFKNADVPVVTAATGDDTFQEILNASVKYPAQVAGELPDWADDEARWIMHRSIFWGFFGVRDSQGLPVANILNNGGKPQRVLMGYPVDIMQGCPKLSQTAVSTVVASLANLRRGWSIVRHTKGIEFRQSDQVKFMEGQIAMVLDVLQDMLIEDVNAAENLKTAAS